MTYNPQIFKAYDIRGIYKTDFDEEFAFELGSRIGGAFKGKTIVIGRDARSSSASIELELIKGAQRAGLEIISIGLCTTPMFYFAVNYLKADGGIMVTASHNPKEYNGFKVVKEEAIAIGGVVLKDIFEKASLDEMLSGSLVVSDVLDAYVDRTISVSGISGKPKSKIVIDTGGGACGLVIKKLLEKLALNYIPLNFEIDGEFKNRSPDPLDSEAQEAMRQAIAEQKADFGVMFDGDGDRVVFVDSQGDKIDSDYILLLLAQQIKDPIVIYDLRMSHIVREKVADWGGKAIETRVGHTFVKALMHHEQADCGGELSGHFPLKDMYYCEASFAVFLKVLNLVETTGESLIQLVSSFRKYAHSGEINFKIIDKASIIKRLKERYSDAVISELDGVTITYPDWWFNVRASNTEPLLRLVVEATDQASMKERIAEVTHTIAN